MTDPASRTWADMISANPDHSQFYIERFKQMDREGRDLHGEARLIDAMLGRGAKVLDAGCGPGRVGGRLASLGHHVVGVDLDPELIAEANSVHPTATWVVGDLETFDSVARGSESHFDVVFSAGNVLPFVREDGRAAAVATMARHTATDGRLVIGFGSGRGYGFDAFLADAAAVGMRPDHLASTWDLRPLTDQSDFIVAILSHE
ncbi:MAG: class I SAM-dependent methyltransferase [Microthrixaceae bacterium]